MVTKPNGHETISPASQTYTFSKHLASSLSIVFILNRVCQLWDNVKKEGPSANNATSHFKKFELDNEF